MTIEKQSPLSGKMNSMDLDITQAQLNAHNSGELIQNVMPNLTRGEREFLISGITPEEWDEQFGSLED